MKKASEVLSKTRREALLELSDHLGIEFQNIVLLHEALTHTSYANESKNKGVVLISSSACPSAPKAS